MDSENLNIVNPELEVPSDADCREKVLALLEHIDGYVLNEIDELEKRQPSLVDPLERKIDFVREASELAGQRMILKGLSRSFGGELGSTEASR